MLKTRSLQHHWGSKFQWLTGPSSCWFGCFPSLPRGFLDENLEQSVALFICSFGVWNWWRKTFYRYNFEMFADREVGIKILETLKSSSTSWLHHCCCLCAEILSLHFWPAFGALHHIRPDRNRAVNRVADIIYWWLINDSTTAHLIDLEQQWRKMCNLLNCSQCFTDPCFAIWLLSLFFLSETSCFCSLHRKD